MHRFDVILYVRLTYEWIDNDHNDFEDENTTILYVELTSALLLSQRIKYEL